MQTSLEKVSTKTKPDTALYYVAPASKDENPREYLRRILSTKIKSTTNKAERVTYDFLRNIAYGIINAEIKTKNGKQLYTLTSVLDDVKSILETHITTNNVFDGTSLTAHMKACITFLNTLMYASININFNLEEVIKKIQAIERLNLPSMARVKIPSLYEIVKKNYNKSIDVKTNTTTKRSGVLDKYKLCLISDLPGKDKSKAKEGIIYLSSNSRHFVVRTINGEIYEDKLPKKIEMSNLKSNLTSETFIKKVLNFTSKKGYTRFDLESQLEIVANASKRFFYSREYENLVTSFADDIKRLNSQGFLQLDISSGTRENKTHQYFGEINDQLTNMLSNNIVSEIDAKKCVAKCQFYVDTLGKLIVVHQDLQAALCFLVAFSRIPKEKIKNPAPRGGVLSCCKLHL